MDRPWVTPEQVKDYSDSEKVKARSDIKLAIDITRAERYVIFHTHNKFDTEEYKEKLPSDVEMAVIILAEAYAKQSIAQKDGVMVSESFDDYSYTVDTDGDVAAGLNLGPMLDEYVLEQSNGKVIMKLRKL